MVTATTGLRAIDLSEIGKIDRVLSLLQRVSGLTAEGIQFIKDSAGLV
jgi:hypothetical protein